MYTSVMIYDLVIKEMIYYKVNNVKVRVRRSYEYTLNNYVEAIKTVTFNYNTGNSILDNYLLIRHLI